MSDRAPHTVVVNCIGLLCPMPILQVRLASNQLVPGDILEVVADDPIFEKEIRQFCFLAQLELVAVEPRIETAPPHTYYALKIL